MLGLLFVVLFVLFCFLYLFIMWRERERASELGGEYTGRVFEWNGEHGYFTCMVVGLPCWHVCFVDCNAYF